jgi:acyl carrier protein
VRAALLSTDRRVRHLISQRKHVRMGQLRPATSFVHELHFDLVDVVDIILAVESRFQLTIPDEVPLDTVGDLLRYVRHYQAAG